MTEWWSPRRVGPDGAMLPASSGVGVGIAIPEDLAVLRIMFRVANAVLCARYFDEVLEVVAEQTLSALGASSVSVSRWEPDADILRTLINVGDLQPNEERWPDSDTYPLADDPDVIDLLRRGRPYVHAVDDDDVSPAVLTYLHGAGKECEVAVPVMFEDAVWGEIWASGVAGRRFGPDDIQLMQAIAAYTAVAIGRGELFSTIWRYAHQDPLTDLPNRRALEQRFTEVDWPAAVSTILVGDLDGLKEINDHLGHAAGDELLRGVAMALRQSSASFDHAVAARLGGDEFCVLLPSGTLLDAENFAHATSSSIGEMLGAHVTMTWGAAQSGPNARSGMELLDAADVELRHAKALGAGRFSAGSPAVQVVPTGLDRRAASEGRRAVDSLISRVMTLVDRQRPLAIGTALEILAMQAQNAIDGAGWAVSITADGGTSLATHRGVDGTRDAVSGLWVLRDGALPERYLLADYPASAHAIATGSAFVAAVDSDGGDPAEIELLNRLGYRAVLAVGVVDGAHGYLVEIYSATEQDALAEIADAVRVLTHYCASVAGLPPH